MRISAHPKSPWYSLLAPQVAVYLDGVQQFNCVTADDERGEVECIPDGKRRGRVVIIYPGMNFDAWMAARKEAAHRAFMLPTEPKQFYRDGVATGLFYVGEP